VNIIDFWVKNERGETEFTGGRQDWVQAADIARSCPEFLLDYEDELVADEETSCYNCRFRRWTERTFVCMKR